MKRQRNYEKPGFGRKADKMRPDYASLLKASVNNAVIQLNGIFPGCRRCPRRLAFSTMKGKHSRFYGGSKYPECTFTMKH